MRTPLLLALVACGPKTPAPVASEPEPVEAAEVEAPMTAEIGIKDLLDSMDTTADACEDFYQYACGGWLSSTELPGDQARWSRSFSTVHERNEAYLRNLLEQAAANPAAGGPPGSDAGSVAKADWQRMGEFYGSCVDQDAVNAAGLAPVQDLLDTVDEVKELGDVARVAAQLQAVQVDVLAGIGVYGDLKDPGTNTAYFWQGGLGLPDRDFYLKEDEKSVTLQGDYQEYLAATLVRGGTPAEAAERRAKDVYAFEKGLAEINLPRAELRDPVATYHPKSWDELAKLAPEFDWKGYAEARGLPLDAPIVLHNLEWYSAFAKHLEATPVDTLKAYLRVHVLTDLARVLPVEFTDANHVFYGEKVYGSKEQKPRWKRCVSATLTNLGDAMGRYFVADRFEGDSKDIALEMVSDVETSFKEGLSEISWMDDETAEKAAEKADTLGKKIGFPDEWLDTSTMEVASQPYGSNYRAAVAFHDAREVAKVGQPVDAKEWFMSAPQVNAYYNPLENEMAFPAGILQPPFFHRSLPAAINYGAIGSVIGHELSHGFDDSGRQFDKDGKMEPWWNDEAVERYKEQVQCVVDQYDGFESAGSPVLGELTLGENIADLGGVKVAHGAYMGWAERNGAPEPVDGLTHEQMFFVAYAQNWCSLATPEYTKMLTTTDTHSPGEWRARGPLQNLPAFHKAFGCESGQAMVRENQCEVW